MSAVHINLIVGNNNYDRIDENVEVEEIGQPLPQDEPTSSQTLSDAKTLPGSVLKKFIREKRLNKAI